MFKKTVKNLGDVVLFALGALLVGIDLIQPIYIILFAALAGIVGKRVKGAK